MGAEGATDASVFTENPGNRDYGSRHTTIYRGAF